MRCRVISAVLLLAGCTAAGDAVTPTLTPSASPTPVATTAAAPVVTASPAACIESPATHCWAEPAEVGAYDTTAVPEASGLAASRRNPGVWYLVDDHDDTDRVWAVDASGATIGPIVLDGFAAENAEDLAVGPCADPASSCIYVGDLGDHVDRPSVQIARFAEPDLSGGAPAAPVAVEVVTLTYATGPVDTEALLIDTDASPLVITKEADGARLFAGTGWGDQVLAEVGPVAVPDDGSGFGALVLDGVQVTGASLDPTSRRVLVRTYDVIAEYVPPDTAAALASFPSWPVRAVPSAPQVQPEAVAWTAAGDGYAMVAEGDPAIWLVTRHP